MIEFAGTRVKRIDSNFKRRCDRPPGLEDVTPHVLRHSAAVWMAEAGVPMSEIGSILATPARA